ncbi:MAG TPA: hypothetical protein VMU53_05190 [Candidatus Sulfotelmatobacter sp.]|nr:hypothetical protein [Candidatus Sulfotelmatobacter sp.]
MQRSTHLVMALFVLLAVLLAGSVASAGGNDNILANLHKVSTIASTVPANGDVNPYGVAKVKNTVGNLTEGHILVSNFNNSANAQGTGTTIVDVAPDGALTLFAQINASTLPGPCPGGVGLTTALVVLRSGWVIVGSLPTSDGTSATAQAGCLLVLNSTGNVVETFYGSLINGPWDMTALDGGDWAALFVTNVLNGTVAANGSVVNQGSVVRIDLGVSEKAMPWIESMTVIGSGFSERTDPAALVIGPTGVGLSRDCDAADPDDCRGNWNSSHPEPVLYVADTLNNRVAVIPNAVTRTGSAGTGATLTKGGSLNGPLGLTVAEGGHILTVNGGDGFITEITQQGAQIAKTLLDNSGTPPGSGALFGLIFEPGHGVIFVDDATNTLNLLH